MTADRTPYLDRLRRDPRVIATAARLEDEAHAALSHAAWRLREAHAVLLEHSPDLLAPGAPGRVLDELEAVIVARAIAHRDRGHALRTTVVIEA